MKKTMLFSVRSMVSVFILVALGVQYIGAQSVSSCLYELKGQIIDADTKAPMPYVNLYIKALRRGSTTDEKGNYIFNKICVGSYIIECTHIGCKHLEERIEINGSMTHNFVLTHEDIQLGSVMINAKANETRKTQSVVELSGQALDATKGLPLAEALKSLVGVTTLNTGSAISKPVIQGLHSNRIVIFNNGVRQEGQQWGSEHAPEIDPFIADKISVIKGANAVQYGGEAMGGVILLKTKPLRETTGVNGEFNLVGFSNGQTGVVSGIIENKFSDKIPLVVRLQGTFKRGGNVRTTDYFLANTGVKEYNFSGTLGYKKGIFESEVFYSQFNTNIGIFRGSHIGTIADLKAAIAAQEPTIKADFTYKIARPAQHIEHELFKWDNYIRTGDLGKINLKFTRQYDLRQEFDAHRLYGSVPTALIDPEMQFEITTYTGDAVWEHSNLNHFRGKIGLQSMQQRNTTDRGGLIPNFNTFSQGIFWVEHWQKQDFPLELEAGVRYDYKHLAVAARPDAALDAQPKTDKTYNFNNFSGSLGAIYKLTTHTQIIFNTGTAWRTPNVNELFSYGVHHGTASFVIGKADLKTEQALNTSLTFGFDNHQRLKASATVYINAIKHFIYESPQQEPILTVRGAFPTFRFEQANARLMGFDAALQALLLPHLTLESKVSLLRARNLDADEWLPLMPSDRFQNGLRYEFKDKKYLQKSYCSLNVMNVFRQTRIPLVGDFAAPPDAYTLFQADIGTTTFIAHFPLEIGLTTYNLFNQRYRDYMNRLRYFSDEMGRNIVLRAKFSF